MGASTTGPPVSILSRCLPISSLTSSRLSAQEEKCSIQRTEEISPSTHAFDFRKGYSAHKLCFHGLIFQPITAEEGETDFVANKGMGFFLYRHLPIITFFRTDKFEWVACLRFSDLEAKDLKAADMSLVLY